MEWASPAGTARALGGGIQRNPESPVSAASHPWPAEIWPSEIARMVREDHAALMVAIQRLRRLLEARDPRGGLPGDLDLQIEGLMQLALDHLDREEALVLPELTDGDAWAPQRVALLLGHHEAERAVVADLRERLRARGPELRQRLFSWLDALEAEILREDAELLNSQVMRDLPLDADPGV